MLIHTGTNDTGTNHIWYQSYLVSIISGINRIWYQSYLVSTTTGTNDSERKVST